MHRFKMRTILISAAIVMVLLDAASALAVPFILEPGETGNFVTRVRVGFRRVGPDGWALNGGREARRAIGYLSGAAAFAVATSPAPDDDSCWYYSDPSQSIGYWSDCPQ